MPRALGSRDDLHKRRGASRSQTRHRSPRDDPEILRLERRNILPDFPEALVKHGSSRDNRHEYPANFPEIDPFVIFRLS